MPAIRYYYNRLSRAHQAIYEQILAGLVSYQAEIRIAGKCADGELWKITEYVILDYPQLFYVGRMLNVVTRGSKVSLCPDYLFSQSTANRVQCQINDKVKTLFGSPNTRGADMFNQERAIFTHLVVNTKYNYNYTEGEHTNFSIIGPLLDGVAVCEGFAKAFKYLCDAVNLPCLVAEGRASAPNVVEQVAHAWNIVNLAGSSYHVDAAWDGCMGSYPYLFYFNLPDSEMALDHTWDRTLVPLCSKEFSTVPCMTSKKMFDQFVIDQANQKRRSFHVKFDKQFDEVEEIIDMVMAALAGASPSVSNMVSGVGVEYNKAQCKAVVKFL